MYYVPSNCFITRFRAAVSVLVRPCCPALLKLYWCKCAYCHIIGLIKWWWFCADEVQRTCGVPVHTSVRQRATAIIFGLRWSMLGRELCLRLSQHRRQLSLSLASTADQRQADPAVAIFCLSVRHTLMLCSNNWLLSSRIRANSGLLVPNMDALRYAFHVLYIKNRIHGIYLTEEVIRREKL